MPHSAYAPASTTQFDALAQPCFDGCIWRQLLLPCPALWQCRFARHCGLIGASRSGPAGFCAAPWTTTHYTQRIGTAGALPSTGATSHNNFSTRRLGSSSPLCWEWAPARWCWNSVNCDDGDRGIPILALRWRFPSPQPPVPLPDSEKRYGDTTQLRDRHPV